MMETVCFLKGREMILILMVFDNVVVISESFIVLMLLLEGNSMDIVMRIRVIKCRQNGVLVVIIRGHIMSIIVSMIEAVMCWVISCDMQASIMVVMVANAIMMRSVSWINMMRLNRTVIVFMMTVVRLNAMNANDFGGLFVVDAAVRLCCVRPVIPVLLLIGFVLNKAVTIVLLITWMVELVWSLFMRDNARLLLFNDFFIIMIISCIMVVVGLIILPLLIRILLLAIANTRVALVEPRLFHGFKIFVTIDVMLGVEGHVLVDFVTTHLRILMK